MPLVAFALGAYIAGLYAGFSGQFGVALVVAFSAGLVGLRRGAHAVIGLAILCAAGGAIARSTAHEDAACEIAAEHSTELRIWIDDSVSAGDFVRARAVDCAVMVAVSIGEGSAPPGSQVVVRGEVLRSDRGLLMQHASIVRVESSSLGLLPRLRNRAGHAIDRTFGGDAPLVRALLIADRQGLSPEIRDRYAAAGLAHILAIAGLHIGFIVVALGLALELAGVSRQRASIVTIATIVLYVAIIGAPVAAIRSAMMLVVLIATRLAQRPTSRWAIVALGASHAVFDPRIVLGVGYQLSVVGVVSMISAGRLGKRLGVYKLPTLKRWVLLTVLGTTVATVGSAPIVALAFGRLCLVAPLSNVAATPLIALAQPMLLLGLLTSWSPVVAHFIADAVHPLLFALDTVARVAASLPYASIEVAPSFAAAAIACVLSFAAIVACASSDWERPASVAVGATALLAWLPSAPLIRGEVELHMIDVGEGDAIALRTPNGHWILFDAGGSWRGGDAGKSTVVPYLGRRGGPVDLFVLSHPHTDHVGGASSVFRILHPTTFLDAGFPGAAEAYHDALTLARADRIHWQRAHPDDRFSIDGVDLHVLAPDSSWTSRLVDPNLASVVMLVQFGDVRMLLMGDAELPEEQWLLAHARDDLHADILKVGHHGSKTSSTDAFLDAVRPRLALVSVGAGNVYHLPTPMIMTRLAAHGAQVLRTDRVGTIIARTDGHRIVVSTAGDEWELSRSGSAP